MACTGYPPTTTDPGRAGAGPGYGPIHGARAVHRPVRWRWSVAVRWALAGVLVAGFGTWAILQWRGHRATFDDAFISYRYAENLVRGDGLVFNAGERVEGYTNFLWTLLAAAAIALKRDPFTVTRTVGVASYAAIVCGTVALLWWFDGRRWRSYLVAPLAAVLVVPDGIASMAGTGLETYFVAFLLVATGVLMHFVDLRSARAKLLASLVPLAACLTRLDASVCLAASVLVTLVGVTASTRSLRRTARELLLRYGLPGIGLAVYLAWKWRYYGDLLPNTYYAKVADIPQNLEAGLAYVQEFANSDPQVYVLIPMLLLGVAGARCRRAMAVAAYVFLTTGFFLAYVIHVGGDFMHYRFMFEIYPLFVLGAGIGLLGLMRLSSMAVAGSIALAVFLSSSPLREEQRFGMQAIVDMNRFAKEGTEVGKALRQVMPPGVSIATTLVGTIGYYSRLRILDQWGLTDKFVAHTTKAGLKTRGHEKFAPESYVRSSGIHLFMSHPLFCSCASPCIESLPNVFVRTGQDRCVRTWYMNQDPELTRHFCGHKESFVLNKVDCAGETGSEGN